MSWIELHAQAALLLLGLFSLLWLISLPLRDASIVDVAWGPAFAACAWLWLLTAPAGGTPRSWLVVGLCTVWALRLGGYIAWRNHGKGEDPRYTRWREEADGAWWWRSYFTVFLLQGALVAIIASPLLAAQRTERPLGWLDAAAALVWLVGFVFEAGGDWQLARFKAKPENRGRLLTSGLWSWTRHPNYFGDACLWWGYWLFAAAAGAWWTVFAPVLMTLLILEVSGVALLEKDLSKSKPGYEDYVRRTNAFFPWPPR